MGQPSEEKTPDLLTSPKEFFGEMVADAMKQRQVKTMPLVEQYLVNLLEFYITADNLYDSSDESGKRKQETLAEMLLKAASTEESKTKLDLLKRLGDTSLYISGFFGDSLKRKIVDIDYYADIGGTAYGSLASLQQSDIHGKVYSEIAHRFMDFVDVLTYISQQSLVQTNEDLLRLYDRYIATGSSLAREQLIEKGLLNITAKTTKQ